MALNLFTLGIPCVYYGSEQGFDGQGGSDEYIRESMFGGAFGAFRSRDRHFFDEDSSVYMAVARLARLRKQEMALRRGRQYLREISGDGIHFGLPGIIGQSPMRAVIAWSRLFADEEVLCAVSTEPRAQLAVWATIDSALHPPGSELRLLLATNDSGVIVPTSLTVEGRDGRSIVQVTVAPGGVVVYK